jgi:hypothetical protein
MKAKFRAILTSTLIVLPLCGGLPGCNQSDNPKIAEAPKPAAPKTEEVAAPTRGGGGKVPDFAGNKKYKSAMDRLDKQGE